MKKIILLTGLLISGYIQGYGQVKVPCYESTDATKWADSVFAEMSYPQKIGQLFMVDAFSNKDSLHVAQIANLIDSFYIGGLIFFQGGPVRQATLTNYYQSLSTIPLMVGVDGEWGLNMRLDSTIRFPRQMTLGAGANEKLVYDMGAEIARQCRRIGIHINFAPDIDINNNPQNPIINSRSFGEDKQKVADLGLNYMLGLQSNHVLACGKHFPGHGDTDTDSHLALPVVNADLARLDTLELFPFKKLIDKGLSSVMVAHLFVPGIDTTSGQASTLSEKVVKGMLKDSLGFTGLIFTDALNMKGVASFFAPGELELKALLAGNDVLLYSQNIPKAVERIHFAIQNCEIDQSIIDEKVKKILKAKYWVGLNFRKDIVTENLTADLNSPDALWLSYQMFEMAPTLLKNKNRVLPLSPFYNDCIASVALNDTLNNPFQIQLATYAHVDAYRSAKDATDGFIDSLVAKLDDYDRVIVSIHNTSINAAKNFGLSPQTIKIVEKLSHKSGAIIVVFGNAYVLGKLEGLDHYAAIIQAYEDTYFPHIQVAQKLFGAQEFTGKMPVTSPPMFHLNEGLTSDRMDLLKYTLPEDAGVHSASLSPIDSMVAGAIRDSVFPGCQIMIARNGKVIYNKAFGKHTYEGNSPVKVNDIYDIASVTKIAATALAAMYLVDKKKLDIDAKASKYLHELRSTNKKDLTIRQMMAHEAGLKAWIPFWKETVDSNGCLERLYRKSAEENFEVLVADSMYLSNAYTDTIWSRILSSPVDLPGKYVYSDLGILILQKVIEKISGKALDVLVNEVFYKPMGLWEIGYQPRDWMQRDRIVPTEIDTVFRHQMIQGFVHDPAAAMMGGVAGHAGVFSSAQSLGMIMQMLGNKGAYGGKRYIKAETVNKFITKAFPESTNRRALFFDKPDPLAGENGPTAISASPFTFGHSGFTGTCAWADPKAGLVYVFLSNRVYPASSNNKLSKSNLRTRVMQVVYDAFKP